MRTHPFVGSFFIAAGLALFALGAFARGGPAFLDRLPVPPEIAVPFVLWQLATWSLLFGVFFLRPRGGGRARGRFPRAVPRV